MGGGNDGDWYWRYRVANGNQISRSSEGYQNERDCERSIEIMKESSDSPVINVNG